MNIKQLKEALDQIDRGVSEAKKAIAAAPSYEIDGETLRELLEHLLGGNENDDNGSPSIFPPS